MCGQPGHWASGMSRSPVYLALSLMAFFNHLHSAHSLPYVQSERRIETLKNDYAKVERHSWDNRCGLYDVR